ncbi:bifunctional 4-hydroxy-2-oxoglutarate aldolase/2-dehydro-3-deoxy-phosphogluconate aldolase [Paraglaciecola sp. 25GB23A]|uniref:bifunctional 4-hydroxy-2-oxoglutarate aldolase/2-dehydro-3-deoxy-phosphogluconate aldolase n=1 Tax=Paraglaciecola sp. 25GB23A TaxID=3156068 RepID=UPI0032AF2B9C
MQSISSLMGTQTLLPIIQTNSVEEGVNIARAMEQAGLHSVEIVLRSEASLQALSEIKRAFPKLLVGAGTVYNTTILDAAINAGADYIVTPTVTNSLLLAMLSSGIPFIPGVQNMRDIAEVMEHGITEMKLFPAELSGGVAFLKAISSLFKHIQFCPTGGVNPANKDSYLALPNVFAVGGTWVAKAEWVAAGQWAEITQACVAANSFKAS